MLKNRNYVYGPEDTTVPLHLNFGQFILGRLSRYQDKIAQINGATDEVITYKNIVQQSMRFAISLSHIGVRKGEMIAILSENRPEYWGAVIGSVCVGATVTTISHMYAEAELRHVLNISKPKYLIASPKLYKKHENIIKSFDCIDKIIMFGAVTDDAVYSFDKLAIADDKSEIDIKDFTVVDVIGQVDVLFVIYSSGTTGMPKGVCLTHYNVITACCMPSLLDPDLKGLNIRSWYHVTGLIGVLASMAFGRLGIYLDGFNLELYLKTIEKYKVQQLTLAPAVLIAICKSNIECDLSSVSLIYSATAPLHKDVISAAFKKLTNLKGILQGYGSSETTLAMIRYTYSDLDDVKPGSVGFIAPGSVAKILDVKSGQAVGPNEQGEIYVKSPLVMKGYIGRDRAEDFDDEDFYRTGDVGYYDEEGHFYICDRLKELIKYKGYQVPPAEIEAVLVQHAAVKDAGVIGVPDDATGEKPLAFVVVQPGKEVTEHELKKFVASQLSDPKHLRGGVRFVNSLPKNTNGKLLRSELKKWLK